MTDTLQSNVLTVNDQGQVGAVFPGGIQIPEVPASGTSAPAGSAVSFIRQSDGSVIAQLFSEGFGGTDVLVLQTTQAAIPGDPSNRREYDLNTQSPDGTASVNLTGFAENAVGSGGAGNGAGIAAQASMGATFANPIIINAQGKSSFLQLLSTQKRVLAGGSASFTWPGASSLSNVITVAHGLGAAPVWLDATPSQGGAGGDLLSAEIWADATNVYVRGGFIAGFAPPAGTSSSFYWKAIG